jgi:hypothetical protein
MAKRAKKRTRSLFTAAILAIGLGLFISFGVLRSQDSRSQAVTSTTDVSLSLYLHGIGKAGDAANPLYDANLNPKHTIREIVIDFSRENEYFASGMNSTVTYNSEKALFEGDMEFLDLPPGTYNVKVSSPGYLDGESEFPVTVASGSAVVVPAITLIAGDTNTNKRLDVLDYTIIFDCLELTEPATACSAEKKSAADIDDDGKVTQYDYNLFLRELSAASQQNAISVADDITPSLEPTIELPLINTP